MRIINREQLYSAPDGIAFMVACDDNDGFNPENILIKINTIPRTQDSMHGGVMCSYLADFDNTGSGRHGELIWPDFEELCDNRQELPSDPGKWLLDLRDYDFFILPHSNDLLRAQRFLAGAARLCYDINQWLDAPAEYQAPDVEIKSVTDMLAAATHNAKANPNTKEVYASLLGDFDETLVTATLLITLLRRDHGVLDKQRRYVPTLADLEAVRRQCKEIVE